MFPKERRTKQKQLIALSAIVPEGMCATGCLPLAFPQDSIFSGISEGCT